MANEKKSFWEPANLRSLALIIGLVLAFRWTFFAPYHVPTASMEPTVKVGDRLAALKFYYDIKVPFTNITLFNISEPERGDVILFDYPKDHDINFVKRVVGLPGDRLRVEDDTLYVNGEPFTAITQEDRSILNDIADQKEYKKLYLEDNGIKQYNVMYNMQGYKNAFTQRFPADGEYVVPEGHLFGMGDNRDNSSDSRFWGAIPRKLIRGKLVRVLWSFYVPEGDTFPTVRFARFGSSLQ